MNLVKHTKLEDHPATLKPMRNTVLVKMDDIAEKTAGGMYIPDTAKDKEKAIGTSGLLIAVGVNAWEDIGDGKQQALPGQRVRFRRYAGTTVKDPVTDEEFWIMNDEDLLAVEGVTNG